MNSEYVYELVCEHDRLQKAAKKHKNQASREGSRDEQTRPKLRFFSLGEPECVITLTNVAGIFSTSLVIIYSPCKASIHNWVATHIALKEGKALKWHQTSLWKELVIVLFHSTIFLLSPSVT